MHEIDSQLLAAVCGGAGDYFACVNGAFANKDAAVIKTARTDDRQAGRADGIASVREVGDAAKAMQLAISKCP